MVLCSTGLYVNMNKGIISKLCNQVNQLFTYKICVLVFYWFFNLHVKQIIPIAVLISPIGMLAKTHFFFTVCFPFFHIDRDFQYFLRFTVTFTDFFSKFLPFSYLMLL